MKFAEPVLEIIDLAESDVIVTSQTCGGIDPSTGVWLTDIL